MSRPHRSPVRRFVIVAGLFLLFIFGTYFGVRAFRLSGVPDIGAPFDLQANSTVFVEKNDNAFNDYNDAADLYVEMSPEIAENYPQVVEQGWELAGDGLKQWLTDNQPALEIWQQGTEKPDSLYIQPQDFTIATLLPVTQKLREFARISLLNAQRLRHEGNPQLAWQEYRATLRCSRHSGMHGCLIERLVGAAIFAMTEEQMLDWSAEEQLTTEELRTALHELKDIYAMTAPFSETLRVEYFVNRSSQTLGISNSQSNNQATSPGKSVPAALLLGLTGEGELSRRTSQLVFANWLSQCDIPRYQRTNYLANSQIPFDRDEQNPSPQIPLSRSQLQAAIDRSFLAKMLMPALQQGDDAITREQTRYAVLQTALALQIYHREHGEFPETLQELEGGDLKTLPIDPYSQGQPLGYRRDDQTQNAILWSVAADGNDDLGNIDWDSNKQPGDWIFQIDKPGAEAAKATTVE